MKKTLLIALLCTTLSTTTAYSAEIVSSASGNNYSWQIDSDGVLTISGSGALNTSWKNDANIDSVTDIVIERGVTSIGSYAFNDMDSVKSLVIPNTVTSIGAYAFDGMSSVTSLDIPSTVTSIAAGAFRSMTSVRGELKIPEGVTLIGGTAFSGMSSVTGEIKIPEGVTSIGAYTFNGMSSVTSLVIPSTVTSIGSSAFQNMSSVTGEIKIPEGVTTIGATAFNGMSSVTSLIIPDTVTSIGGTAFGSMKVSNITASAEMLEAYLTHSGGLKADAGGKINITCIGSNGCAAYLAGRGYDLSKFNIINRPKEVKNKDGSTSLYMQGKLIGFKGKRIYTVDEAALVSGKTNTIKLRYK